MKIASVLQIEDEQDLSVVSHKPHVFKILASVQHSFHHPTRFPCRRLKYREPSIHDIGSIMGTEIVLLLGTET